MADVSIKTYIFDAAYAPISLHTDFPIIPIFEPNHNVHGPFTFPTIKGAAYYPFHVFKPRGFSMAVPVIQYVGKVQVP